MSDAHPISLLSQDPTRADATADLPPEVICRVWYTPSFHPPAVVEALAVGYGIGVRLSGWVDRAYNKVINTPDGGLNRFKRRRHTSEDMASGEEAARFRDSLPGRVPEPPDRCWLVLDGIQMTCVFRQEDGSVVNRTVDARGNDPVLYDICLAVFRLAQRNLVASEAQTILAQIGRYLESNHETNS